MNGAGPGFVEIAGTAIFGIAILHTFTAHYFERLAKLRDSGVLTDEEFEDECYHLDPVGNARPGPRRRR